MNNYTIFRALALAIALAISVADTSAFVKKCPNGFICPTSYIQLSQKDISIEQLKRLDRIVNLLEDLVP